MKDGGVWTFAEKQPQSHPPSQRPATATPRTPLGMALQSVSIPVRTVASSRIMMALSRRSVCGEEGGTGNISLPQGATPRGFSCWLITNLAWRKEVSFFCSSLTVSPP